MGYFYLLIAAVIVYYIYIYIRGSRYSLNEKEFKQGNITVNFIQKTIQIKSKTYSVNQVTGIQWRALTSSRKHGDSQMKTVVIDLDDFERPHYKMSFMSQGQAEKFVQRLSTALRKAGGPSFV